MMVHKVDKNYFAALEDSYQYVDKPGKFEANVHVEIPTLWIVAMGLGAASCMVITSIILLVLWSRYSR